MRIFFIFTLLLSSSIQARVFKCEDKITLPDLSRSVISIQIIKNKKNSLNTIKLFDGVSDESMGTEFKCSYSEENQYLFSCVREEINQEHGTVSVVDVIWSLYTSSQTFGFPEGGNEESYSIFHQKWDTDMPVSSALELLHFYGKPEENCVFQ